VQVTHNEGYKSALLNHSQFQTYLTYFIKMGPVPKEDTTQVPTELMFEAFINSKRIKPVLKREVNNETFFTWLRSCYQINHYYGLLYTVYIGVRGGGRGAATPPGLKNFRASAGCSKILDDKKIFQYSEKFLGNSVFQGKRKLLKNPEW